MAYATTYVVDEISNQFVKVRKDTTDKKVQFKEARRPKRFMRVPGFQSVAGDVAIAIKDGVVMATGTARAMTLAAPTPGDDDGKILKVVAGSAAAHTVTAAGGFNGGGTGSDVGTFGGAIADQITVVAWKGVWYVISNTNVTLG